MQKKSLTEVWIALVLNICINAEMNSGINLECASRFTFFAAYERMGLYT